MRFDRVDKELSSPGPIGKEIGERRVDDTYPAFDCPWTW
jgi:hypothetical protein